MYCEPSIDAQEGPNEAGAPNVVGATLRTWLERGASLGPPTAVDYALQLCEALAAAMSTQGAVHGKLRPESIVLDDSGQIERVDLASAKPSLETDAVDGRKSGTRAAHAGREVPLYWSPEQIRESSQLDVRSDIWAIGCITYELLAGQSPFDRGGLLQTCVAVLEQEPAALAEQRSDVPQGLAAAISRCLQKDPAARFADLTTLAAALQPFGSGRYNLYKETESKPVVHVRQTMVLGPSEGDGTPQRIAHYKAGGRMETLAFDPSALLGIEQDTISTPEVVDSNSFTEAVISEPRESVYALARRTWQNTRVSVPAMLVGLLLCGLLGGAVLLHSANVEREPRQPKILHLVTPRPPVARDQTSND
ncbi:MAG TPA: serine/threonine-protein kinase [Polyangiales bacterium]|nr:serine/threonine-protein kinase [Polyangiales bacterium]